ncbi:MAG: oligosaccharide flippase family protein [Ekhidna sp.]|nr:oligosaccharide flippase family protein [Ekhidna sp.]
MKSPNHLGFVGKLKFLFRDSVIYGGSTAVSRLAAFLVFPIVTRHFSVADYGIIDAFTAMSALLVNMLVFGQDSAVIRYFYEYSKKKHQRRVVSNALLIQLLFLITIAPPLIFFAHSIAEFYTNDVVNETLIRLIILQVPFDMLINFSVHLLRLNFQRFQFLLLSLGQSLIYTSAIAIGIVFFEISVYDVFIIILLCRGVFGLLGLFLVRKWITLSISKKHCKELMIFAIPYGVICTIDAFLPALDRFFISQYLSDHDLGLYAVGYKIALLVQFPISAFEAAWIPFYMSFFKNKDSNTTYQLVALFYSAMLSVIALTLILFRNDILILMTSDKYSGAIVTIAPIILGFAVRSMGGVLGIGIDLSKKSYLKIYSYLGGAAITVTTTILLIKSTGILGVSLGFFFGLLASTIITAVLSARVYRIGFDYKSILFAFFAVPLIATLSYNSFGHHMMREFINVSLIISFAAILWFFCLKKEVKSIVRNNK